MQFMRRLAKILAWSLALGLVLTAAATWFAYAFVTDGDTVARLMQAELRRFFPRATFEFERVEFRPLKGKATLRKLSAIQAVDGRPFPTLSILWLEMRFNPWRLLHGEFEAEEVVVSRPTLRLIRKRDGGWNLLDLPATPWPQADIENPPPVKIVNGTIELVVGPESDPMSPTDARASSSPEEGTTTSAPILRDVTLTVQAAEGGRLQFEGSAQGELFDRVALKGTVDPTTGDLRMEGRVANGKLETLRRRLPPELAAELDKLSLKSGDLDVDVKDVAFRPGAAPEEMISYDLGVHLRNGVGECPMLPFPLNDLSVNLAVQDGVVRINHAEGANGTTRLRASGTIAAGDLARAPMAVRVEAFDLPMDERLKARTPPEFVELWDVFKPEGRVNVRADLTRGAAGAPVALAAGVELLNVSGEYRHFPYALKNLKGSLILTGHRLTINLDGPVGNQPARLWGTVDDPGPDASVDLWVEAEALPIDAAFLNALPPDVRRWVDRFKPSGSVHGLAHIRREPLAGPPPVKEEGLLAIDAELDLDPRSCEITWEGLPYTIRNLSGKLELHPDLWIFRDLRGRNGQAAIDGSGRVERLPGPDLPNGDPPLKIGMTIDARNLPFNNELRDALQDAWRKSWSFINPNGASDVHAVIAMETGKPDDTRVTITPLPESGINLVIPRSPGPGVEPGSTIELPMQDALGTFKFVNGEVAMEKVRFKFHGASVEFADGKVKVEDSGRFALEVHDLWVKNLLFNAALRRIMPTLMAQIALRLDDGKSFSALGDLKIGWSGEPGVPAWCQWEKTQVYFIGNKIKAEMPLEHINGKFKDVWGRSDGRYLEVRGVLDLDSVTMAGLQFTRLQGPLTVKDGVSRLESLKGKLLGGELYGEGWITLADTPRFAGRMQLAGANLQEYARDLRGRQTFRGILNANASVEGLGSDIRKLQGQGEGHVVDGDIGELPVVLRFAKALNNAILPGVSRKSGKSMFDSADLRFRINNGNTSFEEIKLTGDAISLRGQGERDPFDNIDLKFDVVYGRNSFDVPIFSRLAREAAGNIVKVHVTGTLAQPQSNLLYGPNIPRPGGGRD